MDFLRSKLYHLSAPERPRKAPMEVLAVGLPRSGTESLSRALMMLGFEHTWHGFDQFATPSEAEILSTLGQRKWNGTNDGHSNLTAEDFDRIFGHCTAITDLPAAAFARELILSYPEAKVIMNYRRDEDAWYNSIVATMDRDYSFWTSPFATLFCAEAFWTRRANVDFMCQGVFRGSIRQNARWARQEHHAMIRGLVPPNRLLEWDPEDGWAPLCKFLGKKAPDEDFPKGNPTDAMLMRIANLLAQWRRTILWNMSVILSLLACAAYSILNILRR